MASVAITERILRQIARNLTSVVDAGNSVRRWDALSDSPYLPGDILLSEQDERIPDITEQPNGDHTAAQWAHLPVFIEWIFAPLSTHTSSSAECRRRTAVMEAALRGTRAKQVLTETVSPTEQLAQSTWVVARGDMEFGGGLVSATIILDVLYATDGNSPYTLAGNITELTE